MQTGGRETFAATSAAFPRAKDNAIPHTHSLTQIHPHAGGVRNLP